LNRPAAYISMDLFEDVQRAGSACAKAEKDAEEAARDAKDDDFGGLALAGHRAILGVAAALAAQRWRAPGHGRCVRVDEARSAVFDCLAGRSSGLSTSRGSAPKPRRRTWKRPALFTYA
jgi:hypothetical protein